MADLCTKIKIPTLTHCKDMNGDDKCKNLDGLGGLGHPRSSETSAFDRAHMTSYSTLIEIIRLSCTVFELQHVFRRKWPILTHTTCTCRLSPRREWSRSNFAVIFGIRKLDSRRYRAALFAWSWPFWYNTGVCQTDRHTDTRRRHIPHSVTW